VVDATAWAIFDWVYRDADTMTRNSGRLAALALALLAAVVLAGSSSGADHRARGVVPARAAELSLAGKATVVVSLNASRKGTFTVRGAFTDSGPARGSRTVSANRARLTLRLLGDSGTIKVLVIQACGKLKSTWKVLSGSTRAYQGLSGSGAGKGRIACKGTAAHRGVYTGSIRTPPAPPLAQPGLYRGSGFSPNLRATLEVLPDGRSITNLSFRQVVARCQSSAVTFLEPEFSGTYPLSDRGRFLITSEGYTVSGKLSLGRAKGTVAVDAKGCKAGPLSWSATIPPTPLPTVPAGRYCGFTLAGPGICLDATAGAWVTKVHMGFTIRCTQPEAKSFPVEYTYEGLIAIRADLTFSATLSNIPLEDGGSMRFTISGTFDGAGEATGKGGFSRISLVREGTRYKCRNATPSWSAKRGA
jgi:hypothetical protein